MASPFKETNIETCKLPPPRITDASDNSFILIKTNVKF